MDQARRCWLRSATLGLISGFLAGMLWWVGLMIAFGSSATVTSQNGQRGELSHGYVPAVAGYFFTSE